MNRRGSGTRLGSPATANARVHAATKELARLDRLNRIECRALKASIGPVRQQRRRA